MSDETKCRAYVDGAHYFHPEDGRCACGADKRMADKDAEIARLRQEAFDAAINKIEDEQEHARVEGLLEQARAERDAAIVACQRISGYAGLIIKDGLKDHTFYRIENIKALADEQISAYEALTSMERGEA